MLLSALELSDFMRRFRLDFPAWKPALEAICRAHAIPADPIHPFTEGSNLIARVADDRVVKIFPEFHRHQWENEWRTLRRLQSALLPIRIPKLLAHGQRPEGWAYVIVDYLPGVLLEQIWSGLTGLEKSSVLRQIGQIMASVHHRAMGELEDLQPGWSAFLEKQAGGALQRQILHRSSELKQQVRLPAWETRVQSFQELVDLIFPVPCTA
jgi:hygromycin-B 7''-O-kinase